MLTCQTCDLKTSEVHVHHIVPKSIGGLDIPGNRVLICMKCHSLIHQRSFVSHRNLVQQGLRKAKESGVKLGPPKKINDAIVSDIITMRALGKSHKAIAANLNLSVGSVWKITSSQGW